jgi:uncharacterized membrane protein YfcA
MRQRSIYLPELVLIGATRGMLGAGIGMLLADRIGQNHRKIIGGVLLIAGALSTIPLALRVFRRDRIQKREKGAVEEASMMH